MAALSEQKKVHHVGAQAKLKDELTTWQPLLSKKSPNRLDAFAWAMTDLMLGPQVPGFKRRRRCGRSYGGGSKKRSAIQGQNSSSP